jgi:hypothetical protein
VSGTDERLYIPRKEGEACDDKEVPGRDKGPQAPTSRKEKGAFMEGEGRKEDSVVVG